MSIAQSTRAPTADAVLVCALGRVGLQCVKALRGYRVPVRAIDLRPRGENMLELEPDALTVGDFRDIDTLLRAGVAQCRSIVLLSADPAANIEGALAARRANPNIRLVVRAEERNWHRLLATELGNLVVYEPNRLAEAAFAFAALDSHVLAHFYVDEHLFQVLDHTVQADDRWCGERIEAVHAADRQIVLHVPADPPESAAPPEFNGWRPDQTLAAGDRLLLLSTAGAPGQRAARRRTAPRRRDGAISLVRHWIARHRRLGLSRPTKIAAIGLCALLALLIVAAVSFSWGAPHLAPGDALRLAILLLFGGHLADVVADFEHLPASVRWAEVGLTICGTILTAVLYALLTDRLLTAHFQLRGRWPRPPARDHVIVVGYGRAVERIGSLLEQFRCRTLALESTQQDARSLLPRVVGNPTEADTLLEARVGSARGLIAATNDDQLNVEIALLAASLNPNCSLAVRTFDPRFTANVTFLLPHAKVLCVASLAATAYAAAALGEHVIHLFETPERSVLVVEYCVAPGDTLIGRELYEVSEGYSIVPVLHQRAGARAYVPKQEKAGTRLVADDRLVVLATAASLEAIERGDLRPPRYELWLERVHPYAEPVQLVSVLTQQLGCTLEQAYAALDTLPQRIPQRVYRLHARRIQRILRRSGIDVRIERWAGDEDPQASDPGGWTPRPEKPQRHDV